MISRENVEENEISSSAKSFVWKLGRSVGEEGTLPGYGSVGSRRSYVFPATQIFFKTAVLSSNIGACWFNYEQLEERHLTIHQHNYMRYGTKNDVDRNNLQKMY